MTDSEPNITKKVERTDYGYRTKVESTRGTGTRDQDKVSVEARTERMPTEEHLSDITHRVKQMMEMRRAHQPDAGEDDE